MACSSQPSAASIPPAHSAPQIAPCSSGNPSTTPACTSESWSASYSSDVWEPGVVTTSLLRGKKRVSQMLAPFGPIDASRPAAYISAMAHDESNHRFDLELR